MEKKPKCSSSTQTQTRSRKCIHHDIWFQILCFLPVKTLLVLRAVSKSFLSIVDDDPNFVSSHLLRFPGNNALETRLLTLKITKHDAFFLRNDDSIIFPKKEDVAIRVLELDNVFGSCPSACNDDSVIIDQWDINNPNTRTILVTTPRPNVQCSLDGLLLLKVRFRLRSSFAILWNPSIRQHRELRLPPPMPNNLQFGLGHGPLSNDYKVVAFDYYYDRAWVYSVGSSTWKEILDTRSRPGLEGFEEGHPLDSYSRSVFFSGRAFWIEHSYTTPRIDTKRLLWFDFGTERFGYAKMPYSSRENTRQMLLMLDGGASVGVWWVHEHRKRVVVWALETDTLSWTLRYELDPCGLTRASLRYCIESRLEESGGGLVWKRWDPCGNEFSVVSYCFDIERQVYRPKQNRSVQNCLGNHFESLVMLKSLPVFDSDDWYYGKC